MRTPGWRGFQSGRPGRVLPGPLCTLKRSNARRRMAFGLGPGSVWIQFQMFVLSRGPECYREVRAQSQWSRRADGSLKLDNSVSVRQGLFCDVRFSLPESVITTRVIGKLFTSSLISPVARRLFTVELGLRTRGSHLSAPLILTRQNRTRALPPMSITCQTSNASTNFFYHGRKMTWSTA